MMKRVAGVRLGLFRMKTHHHSCLLSESPGVPYTLLPWIGHLPASVSGFIFVNAATFRLFIDIYRFIATVIFNTPFKSHCLYDYFGTSLGQGSPALPVRVLSKM
jgi:hypothetical protein